MALECNYNIITVHHKYAWIIILFRALMALGMSLCYIVFAGGAETLYFPGIGQMALDGMLKNEEN